RYRQRDRVNRVGQQHHREQPHRSFHSPRETSEERRAEGPAPPPEPPEPGRRAASPQPDDHKNQPSAEQEPRRNRDEHAKPGDEEEAWEPAERYGREKLRKRVAPERSEDPHGGHGKQLKEHDHRGRQRRTQEKSDTPANHRT